MSKQETSVTPLVGSQSDTTDPILRAEAAMSAALAEFERLDHNAAAHSNGRTEDEPLPAFSVVAELIEAREEIRAEYRTRRSAHTLTGSEAIDAIDAQHREKALLERIGRVLGPGFCNLADYLRTGEPHGVDPHRELVDHATALAEVLSHVDTKSDEITDSAVPRATHLLYGLLYIARTVGDIEDEIETAKFKARMAGEEGGNDE